MRTPEYYYKQLDTKLKHSCADSILGVRMAICGCRLTGIDPSKAEDRKNLIVFLEMDRCASDSIAMVTGCSLGRRNLKYFDFGVLAASFLNTKTGAAARLVAKESPRELSAALKEGGKPGQEPYKTLPDESLFTIQSGLKIDMDFYSQPGVPKKHVACENCGVVVNDNRQVVKGGKVLCKPCAGDAYWTAPDPSH